MVGQQLAGAAAASIWRRTLGELCPRGFDRAQLLSRAEGDDGFDEETRSSCGLSRAKARAIVAVCRAFEAGDLDALLRDAPVAELREKLCAIKGVGPWSCDMYLIFDLKKPGVLPLGDLGVRNGAQRFFGVSGQGKNGSARPKKETEARSFAPYAPYRGGPVRSPLEGFPRSRVDGVWVLVDVRPTPSPRHVDGLGVSLCAIEEVGACSSFLRASPCTQLRRRMGACRYMPLAFRARRPGLRLEVSAWRKTAASRAAAPARTARVAPAPSLDRRGRVHGVAAGTKRSGRIT